MGGSSTLTLNYEWLNKEALKSHVPLLVFLHEGLGSIRQWKTFPSELVKKTGLPAFLYDRIGHGDSPALIEKRSVDYLQKAALEELPGLLDRLNLTNPLILVGHSDGGSIALHFAAEFPERVIGVITEAAHTYVEEEALSGIKRTVEMYKTGRLKEKLDVYHGDKTEALFYAWAGTWLDPAFRDWSIESRLSDVTAPLCVLQGLSDEYASEDHPLEIALKTRGSSEVHLLPDCGHAPHHQQAEKTMQIMETFIRKLIQN